MRIVHCLVIGAALLASSPASAGDPVPAPAISERPEIVVYKSPYCGCCTGWADHVRAHGYRVTTREIDALDIVKRTAGVPEALESCHTAVVDGYVIEGHVPASALDRLLDTRPPVRGLAVPGMPIGSPGMEGGDPEPYDVLSFGRDGEPTVFMSVRPRE